jgi:sortase A
VTLCLWAGVHFVGGWSAARDIAMLTAAAQAAEASRPDMTLWSPQRIKAWEDAQKRDAGPALAVIRIPSVKIEAPVLKGTDDWTLDRGIGHIEDTPMPGESGNIGLAGHRDGYFRGLKDVKVGDQIELQTPTATTKYRIDKIWIVPPEDVSVLDPTPQSAVTLVTCYPFYYVGAAPMRYIVRAVVQSN